MARSRQIGINLTVPSRVDWDSARTGTDDTPFAMACLAAFLLLTPDDAQTLKTLAHNATKLKTETEGWETIIKWVQQRRDGAPAIRSPGDGKTRQPESGRGLLKGAQARAQGQQQAQKQANPKKTASRERA